MTGGGGQELPPLDGGEFLLRLVQGRQQHHPQTPSPPLQTRGLTLDPAVAAVGPTIPLPVNGHHYLAPPHLSPSPPTSGSSFPPNFLLQGFPHNPSWPQQISRSPPPPSPFNAAPHLQSSNFEQRRHQEQGKLMVGKVPFDVVHGDEVSKNSRPLLDLRGKREVGLGNRDRTVNGFHPNWGLDRHVDSGVRGNDRVYRSPETRRQLGSPPGFSGQPPSSRRQGFEHSVSKGSSSSSELSFDQRGLGYGNQDHGRQKRFGERERSNEMELGRQLDHPGPPSGSTLHSVPASEIEESSLNARALAVDNVDEAARLNGHGDEMSDLGEQFVESLVVEDEADGKSEKKKLRDKDFRSDPRGGHTLSQRMRNMKSYIQCRSDMHRHNARFLEIYESLIPAEEEKAKQKQLLSLLEKLVKREWPNAKLYLYGSCANSFGVSKSDIDVCLAIADHDVNKAEVILKLADILQSDNLENVQALTRARVPIVKLKDPVTGVSCDICVNNLLAVVNTKLLRDYAEIDARLRQLAFIVKHWAKSRGVNETYQGTLSSYAYVLMCIHFLQRRRPAILPCLQGMEATYAVTVDNTKYAYFDQVERLRNLGARNKESIAQLVWSFFNYWAYCHDYANSVISVRTGSYLSKHEKDWTRRIGNERHLICIEDPFETSHDLGRVVDKHSIRVLREEFERAAEVLQYDPNPCVELFRPYVPS